MEKLRDRSGLIPKINITEFIKKGENSIEIEVVNLWANRLIGDMQLEPEKEKPGGKS